jgi:hypothetical protein
VGGGVKKCLIRGVIGQLGGGHLAPETVARNRA